MKHWISKLFDVALWVIALGIVTLALWPRDSGPRVGAKGSPFAASLVGADGEFVYSGSSNKPLLIEAFASWCGACRRSAGDVAAVGAAARAGKLDVIAISVDDRAADAQRAMQAWPITVPVAHDGNGSFQRAYDVRVLPTFILLRPDGSVARVTTGPPGPSDLRAFLNPED